MRPPTCSSVTGSLLAVVLILLTGCASTKPNTTGSSGGSGGSSGQGGGSSTPFTVTSATPPSGATNVALNSIIEFNFSSEANASTVNGTDIQLTNPKPVTGTVSYDSGRDIASFTPSASLAANTTYTITVTGVTSSTGVAVTPFTSTFTTASSSSGPPAPMQYQAPLISAANSAYFGQVSVDMSGNVTAQLKGATASETFMLQFCLIEPKENQPNCFSIGTMTTDGNGNGNVTAMFPKPGSWAGDFQLNSGSTEVYSTGITPAEFDTTAVYMSTLQPQSTVDGGILNSGDPQASLTTGTITYSATAGPYGSFTFTLTGAPSSATFNAAEGPLFRGGTNNYELENSQGQGNFQSDSQGNLTVTVQTAGEGGDILSIGPVNPQPQPPSLQGYVGGFSVPAP